MAGMSIKQHQKVYPAVQELARQQYGLVSSRQLDLLGLDRNCRQVLLRNAWVTRVRRGVYRLPGATGSWRASAMAAVLAAGDGAALSHFSAAALWDLVDSAQLEGQLDVTCRRQVRRPGLVAHRVPLRKGDVTTRLNIPVTRIERTLIDIAPGQPTKYVGQLIDDAVRRKLTTTARLFDAVERHRRRGAAQLSTIREALALRGRGYDPGDTPWER